MMNNVEQTEAIQPNVSVEIVHDFESLLDYETNRVNFYLSNFERYQKMGLAGILNFPSSITPGQNYTVEQIKTAVASELETNLSYYENFSRDYSEALDTVKGKALKVALDLYGNSVDSVYDCKIVPTAYGTVGSPGKTMFLRIREFIPEAAKKEFTTDCPRNPLETLVHEILCHSLTATLRADTPIADNVRNFYWAKERLMDLLGYSILIRSSLMQHEQIAMQVQAIQKGANYIDPLFFSVPDVPSVFDLSWEGNLHDLIRKVTSSIESTEDK